MIISPDSIRIIRGNPTTRKIGENGLRGHRGRLVRRRAVWASPSKQENVYRNLRIYKSN